MEALPPNLQDLSLLFSKGEYCVVIKEIEQPPGCPIPLFKTNLRRSGCVSAEPYPPQEEKLK